MMTRSRPKGDISNKEEVQIMFLYSVTVGRKAIGQ